MSWLNEEPRLRKALASATGLTVGTVLALSGTAAPAAHAASGTLGSAAAGSGRYFGPADSMVDHATLRRGPARAGATSRFVMKGR